MGSVTPPRRAFEEVSQGPTSSFSSPLCLQNGKYQRVAALLLNVAEQADPSQSSLIPADVKSEWETNILVIFHWLKKKKNCSKDYY